MTGTAVEQVEAHDLEARKHLNRVLVTADQMAAATSLLRADLRGKVQDVRAIALTLDQHGLPVTINNLNACYVVNGAVEFMTRLWTGLAMARGGHRVWVCDADPAKCTCAAPSSATEGRAHIQRGDDGMTYTATFSWADAERAGLTGSQTYKKFPQDMLGWRALSRAVKRYAPDIVIGVGEAPPDTVRRAAARPLTYDLPDQDEDITDAEIVEPGEDPGIRRSECRTADAAAGDGSSPAGVTASTGASGADVTSSLGTPAGSLPENGPTSPSSGGSARTSAERGAEQTAAPADRDNVAGGPVVDPAAVPGPVDWKAIAKQHGVSQADLLRKAQEFARNRAVDVPETLAAISDDEQVEADTLDWLGE